MKNLTLCWPNYARSATFSGSFMPSLPASNLKDPRSMYLARFVDCLKTTTILTIDLGKARMVGGFGLRNVNFSQLGKYRLLGSSTGSFIAPLYTGEWIKAWPDSAIPMSMRHWQDKNFWTGCASDETRAGMRNTCANVLGSKPALRYWRIEFDDETNPDGYLHIGNVFIGDAWTLEDNFSFGDVMSFDEDNQSEVSLGGQKYVSKAPVTRMYRFEIGSLSDDEVNARLIDMLLVAGKSDEMLVIRDPDDVVNGGRRNFVCEFENLPSITNANVHTRSTEFLLRELI